jgi:glycosyltransferase involved in cell wall biosynthesis
LKAGVKVIYAFPEPLPLPRARGVQVAHATVELAHLGVEVELVHAPAPAGKDGSAPPHPLRYYDLEAPSTLKLVPLSRSLPWPLQRVHSNGFFLRRLERLLAAQRSAPPAERPVLLVRHPKLAALLLARDPVFPLVYEAHEVFADTAPRDKQAALAALEGRIVHKAALVIANSNATAARLVERYGEREDGRKIAVLPNGVDWPLTVPDRDWAHAGRHIVYSGSFFAWKGVTDLVQAAADLPECHITLLGGTEAQVKRELERAPQGRAELDFRGHVPHRDVARALQSACIAVLPNRDDPDSRFTSPIKLYEYMAAGCAIVASDLPALRDILPADAAVWVKPGDPRALAEGIRTLAADGARARALGTRVRELAQGLTWQARAARLAQLLAGVQPG